MAIDRYGYFCKSGRWETMHGNNCTTHRLDFHKVLSRSFLLECMDLASSLFIFKGIDDSIFSAGMFVLPSQLFIVLQEVESVNGFALQRIVHGKPAEKLKTLGLTDGFTIAYNFKREWVDPECNSIP